MRRDVLLSHASRLGAFAVPSQVVQGTLLQPA
jgi:hypothetical protein